MSRRYYDPEATDHPDAIRWGEGCYSRKQAADLAHLALGGILYAARFEDGAIKIGWTEHLSERMSALIGTGGSRPQMLAIHPGTRDDEAALHKQLAAHARRGREWYEPHPVVLEVVNRWRAQLGRAPIPA